MRVYLIDLGLGRVRIVVCLLKSIVSILCLFASPFIVFLSLTKKREGGREEEREGGRERGEREEGGRKRGREGRH